MKIKIRKNVFETNSSSSHSISIFEIKKDSLMDTSLIPNDDGIITIGENCEKEFGWGIETYCNAEIKAMYCYIDRHGDNEGIRMLTNVIKKQTKAEKVVFLYDDDWSDPNYGYIDHQSDGTSSDAFDTEKTLRNFIFNPKSKLYIDNDNH